MSDRSTQQSPVEAELATDEANARGLRRQLAERTSNCPFPNTHEPNPALHFRWCRYRVESMEARS